MAKKARDVERMYSTADAVAKPRSTDGLMVWR
jgi:hypothetical protein